MEDFSFTLELGPNVATAIVAINKKGKPYHLSKPQQLMHTLSLKKSFPQC
jgi:hypothetical protein